MTKQDENNTLIYYSLLFLFLFCFGSAPANAQFIDLTLDIDSELTATTERPLDFGTLVTNSGRRMIEFGSFNMGIFSITALENQLLLINLQKPGELHHDNPAIEATVPLELIARYGYSRESYQNSRLLPEATSHIQVQPNPEPGPWNTLYIFIYGSVNIGDIPEGAYTNQILLDIEYI